MLGEPNYILKSNFMKKHAFLFIIILGSFLNKIFATHIVGGDLSVQQENLNSLKYKITFTLFYDVINANPANLNAQYFVVVFNKNTNTVIEYFELYQENNVTALPYGDSTCNEINLKTNVYKYSVVKTFDSFYYNVPTYFVIETCCRNKIIENIKTPITTGTVFYTEMPALWNSSSRTATNSSSPVFTSTKGEYGCTNQELILDFSCTDADGDKLLYSMTDPLKGFINQNNISYYTYTAGPYPSVNWVNTCDNSNIFSSGYMKVNETTGKVTMFTSRPGLYVLAVKCSEFRNGIKIGETTRDFQILVLECQKIDRLLNKYDPDFPITSPKNALIEININEKDTITATSINTDSLKTNLGVFYSQKILTPNQNLTVTNLKSTVGTIKNQIVFSPDCNLYKQNRLFSYRVVSSKEYCKQHYSDTVTFTYVIKDQMYSSDSLKLTNIFTPNQDGFNDLLIVHGVPLDNCDYKFEDARIFNRWGVQVFHTKNRNMYWDGAHTDDGIYFYEIKYNIKTYKGSVELRR